MRDLTHYTILAEVFRYPAPLKPDYPGELRRITGEIISDPDPAVEEYISHTTRKTIEEQQEYYISTFDVQALCYLDIGYVLYGEDYNRGVFLSHIKQEQENAGNDCGNELPDHLPNILTLLPMLSETSLAEEMIVSLMIPAIRKMIESFHSDGNVYKGMLRVLLKIMELEFPDSQFEEFDFSTQQKAEQFTCLPQWRDIR
ncbi:MAG: hypothetical protein WD577_06830 [Bacteroidales bacterium]